jgi:hypothetical protein
MPSNSTSTRSPADACTFKRWIGWAAPLGDPTP